MRDVRQATTLKSKHKYSGQSDGVRDVKWSPTDGVDFAFGTDSGWIQRWDMRNLKTAKIKIPAHSTTCNTIDWHPDGKHIVSAGSDKTVRVWDFSVSRRQKANWEIKTPYPVLNARWRPSCESAIPFDSGARQCTQLVTAYDDSHPVLHIWDFRRPSLPFREIAPYSIAPTDLLWHSQDLLWTVGREGIFLQTDIQHAAKVINKRSLQALAVSSRGDINFVTLKRRQRRLSKQRQTPSFSNTSQSSESQSAFSRSWQDDSLDNAFLSLIPGKRTEPPRTKTRTQSLNMDPSAGQKPLFTISLDEVLLHRTSARPVQLAVRGVLPGYRDATTTTFLAKRLEIDLKRAYEADNFLTAFNDLINHNARVIDFAGYYRLAQSWRIVGCIVNKTLKQRAEYKRKLLLEGKPELRIPAGRGDLSQVARKILKAHAKSPSPTPPSMKPISTIARHLALSDEASSQPTPLARPVSSSKGGYMQPTILPDPDVAEHLTLPPSLSPTTAEAGIDGRLTSNNLDGLQRLHQSPNGIDKTDMVHRWSIQPKEPLNLDPVDLNGIKIPPKLEKRDSEESFAFLAGSMDSRGASFPSSQASPNSGPQQMVSERPSRTNLAKHFGNGGTEAVDFGNGMAEPSKTTLYDMENLSARPEKSHVLAAAAKEEERNAKPMDIPAREETTAEELGPGSYPDEWGICPSPDLITEKVPPSEKIKRPVSAIPPQIVGNGNRAPESIIDRISMDPSLRDEKDTWLYLPEDGDADLEEGKPIVFIEMLREVVKGRVDKGDAQTAAPFDPPTRPFAASHAPSTACRDPGIGSRVRRMLHSPWLCTNGH